MTLTNTPLIERPSIYTSINVQKWPKLLGKFVDFRIKYREMHWA